MWYLRRLKNPKNRYQTIEEMYNDLSSVLVTSRLNEEKHTRISDTTQTVPIDKKEIKINSKKKLIKRYSANDANSYYQSS